jgi:5-formyltetrahydrofolate cyclo-ligase
VTERVPNAAERKRELRRSVLRRRDSLPEDARRAKSRAIAGRVMALSEIRSARTVRAFWSFGSEVDTRPLLERLAASGRTVVLPTIRDRALEPRTWKPGEELEETWFGASEPVGGRSVDPAAIDVVAVPGVAFDRAGGRVGYGGGFYDRFLGRLRADALRVGIAFSCQLVDEPVPAASFDVPIDAVVTEREVLRLHRGSDAVT